MITRWLKVLAYISAVAAAGALVLLALSLTGERDLNFEAGQPQAEENGLNLEADRLKTVPMQSTRLAGRVFFSERNVDGQSSMRVYNVRAGTFSDVTLPKSDSVYSPILNTSPESVPERLVYLRADRETGEVSVDATNLETRLDETLSDISVSLRRDLAHAATKDNFATAGVRSDFGTEIGTTAKSSDYSIYVKIGAVEEKEIGLGFSPSWSADGARLYFVRTNSIYRYDVRTGRTKALFGREKWYLDFDSPGIVSPDETYFIGYDPGPREINVYRITSVDPFLMEFLKRYPTFENGTLLSPSFSDDGTTYVYANAHEEEERASVVLIDLEKETQTKLFEIPMKEPFSLFPFYTAR